MAIFKCKTEGCSRNTPTIEVHINGYIMKSNPFGYYYKTGGQIVCEECGKPLSIEEEPFSGMPTAMNFFSSRTPQQKKEILKKRANKHFNRNTDGMKEYRDHVEKESNL